MCLSFPLIRGRREGARKYRFEADACANNLGYVWIFADPVQERVECVMKRFKVVCF